MLNMRTLQFVKESTFSEAGRACASPVLRVAALAVFENPFAGKYQEDLGKLINASLEIGARLAPTAIAMLERPATSYGKACVVGINGDIEHAAALMHPNLGNPMRAAVGGGEAIIPSAAKVAVAGTAIDVPLGNKDNVWSFNELDTWTLSLHGAPRPDELLLVIAYGSGGRPHPRVGAGRLAV